MRLPLSLVFALFAYDALFVTARPQKRTYNTHDYYVLEHNPLAGASLAEAATELGLEVVERLGDLQNLWVVRTLKSNSESDRVLDNLQTLHQRASSPLHSRSEHSHQARRIASSVKYLERQELRQRAKRGPIPTPQDDDSSDESKPSAADVVAERLGIEDPMFPQQWHLVNNEYEQNMMNVSMLWEMGITGEGVISTLVDDGLDYTSDDLADNFVRPFLSLMNHIMRFEPFVVFSGLLVRMISTTMKSFRPRNSSTTTTGRGAPVKSEL